MSTQSEILDLSLTEVSKAIQSKKLSPVELVDACLARIDETNNLLNAYITLYPEIARDIAIASEKKIVSGCRIDALQGVPIALKDNIPLRDCITTAGSKVLSKWRPVKDATVARRLKNAGCIVIGKTNMDEFAWGGTSTNPHYGTVRNPWNPERFASGSSGGSAVAVASRSCYGALGTDTGGSIRLPAAVNGIVGIRPTIGRVSNADVIPLAWSMDTVGPLTRTVEDCALMFNALAGYDPCDANSIDLPVDDYTADLQLGVKKLRVSTITNYSFENLQPDVHEAFSAALDVLKGILDTPISEINVEHIEDNRSAQDTIETVEPSAYHQRWLRERPDDYGQDARLFLEIGEMMFATHYVQAQRYRTLLKASFLDAFKFTDVFVFPTLPFTATTIGKNTVEIQDGRSVDLWSALLQFTGVSSLTGLPALTVPCGFDDKNLPIGMQLVGKPFDERTLFKVGVAFQQATNFHKQSPIQ